MSGRANDTTGETQPVDADEKLPRGKRGQGSENMTPEELAFVRAVDEYKRRNDRPFPTLREILQIAKSLGYRRTAPPGA